MRLLLFLVFVQLTAVAWGQQLKGLVVDRETGEPLAKAWIHGLSSGTNAFTDISGSFEIMVSQQDNLHVSLVGYEALDAVVTPGQQYLKVSLAKKRVAMDTVVIRPGLTDYQQDSLERRAIYGKKVDEKPAKFGLRLPNATYGGTASFNAPISSIIQKRTKKYKRLKAFQDRFRKNEGQLFVDSRYTPVLVQELTGLKEDSLALFMSRYPMPYDFARQASQLELMMWVKYNYREWVKPGKQ